MRVRALPACRASPTVRGPPVKPADLASTGRIHALQRRAAPGGRGLGRPARVAPANTIVRLSTSSRSRPPNPPDLLLDVLRHDRLPAPSQPVLPEPTGRTPRAASSYAVAADAAMADKGPAMPATAGRPVNCGAAMATFAETMVPATARAVLVPGAKDETLLQRHPGPTGGVRLRQNRTVCRLPNSRRTGPRSPDRTSGSCEL